MVDTQTGKSTLHTLEILFDSAQGNLRDNRRFICQRYISNPALTPALRKFHIRTYALAVGSLDVYVFRKMLTLFAREEYRNPWDATADSIHLTNACLQEDPIAAKDPPIFDNVVEECGMDEGWKQNVLSQIRNITSDAFAAAARSSPTTFQLLSNCFQLFGIDFLVDQAGKVWLLEVNSGPALTHRDVIPEIFDSIVSITLQRWIKTDDGTIHAMDKILSI